MAFLTTGLLFRACHRLGTLPEGIVDSPHKPPVFLGDDQGAVPDHRIVQLGAIGGTVHLEAAGDLGACKGTFIARNQARRAGGPGASKSETFAEESGQRPIIRVE